VANFFRNKRINKDYIPADKTELKHVDEVLKLLSVMTKDQRYERMLSKGDGREVHTMCDVAERLEQRGKEIGREEGIKEGKLEVLLELVREGVIEAKDAAEKLGVEEKEILEKL
jgi:predicted transposase YdaD